MCQGIRHQQLPQRKQKLVERLGGSHHYEVINLAFCENILEDCRLTEIYEDHDIDSLADLQKRLLDITFLQEQENNEKISDAARNQIILQNYSLFEKGLNAHHFDILREHFLTALYESWIQDGEIVELCEQRFEMLRSIFDEGGNEIENTRQMQQQVVEACS